MKNVRLDNELVFKEAYKELYDKLLKFVIGYIPDKEEAENIVQNCFAKLWESRDKVMNEKNLTGWLFTVAKNECLSFITHQRIKTQYENSVFQRELSANLNALSLMEFNNLNHFEIDDIIRRTLNRLPRRCRQVWELSRDKRKRNCDIAIECGISVKAVEAHITKALQALRIALKDYL